ncbi:MAG: hypothetical protein ACM3WP_25690 [Acidobacteriota bacterium]
MKINSLTAMMFISLMAVAAMTVIVRGVLSIHPLHQIQFACLLLLGLVTSRLKVRLPGLTGNMSMNLPFVFLAIVQLGLFEAAAIAFVSTLIQSLPKHGVQLRPAQLLFNVSTMTTAAGLAYLVFHEFDGRHGVSGSPALVLAAATYFFINTLPVATIICLTEGATMVRTWSEIVHLSFPYYVASAGITSILTGKSGYMAWALSIGALPVMIAMHRSYCRYFGEVASTRQGSVDSRPLTKAAAAG